MPHGGHGLAMLAGLPELPKVATPEAAARIKQCLTPFRALRPRDQDELEQSLAAIEYLTVPAPGSWIAAKVVSLLSHFFTAQQEAAVAKAIALDWADMLSEYPAWAIANACRWWLSRENPRRSYKPVPGDIQDRAHVELEGVRAAKVMVSLGVPPDEPTRAPVAPPTQLERASFAAEVLSKAALGVKGG